MGRFGGIVEGFWSGLRRDLFERFDGRRENLLSIFREVLEIRPKRFSTEFLEGLTDQSGEELVLFGWRSSFD